MAIRTDAELTADIATIDDSGANTAAEVRSLLTNIKDTLFGLAPTDAFNTLFRNHPGYPMTLTFDADDYIATKTLTTDDGPIVFTYNYIGQNQSKNLITVVASGSGYAATGLTVTTKTITYDGNDNITSVVIS